ncbi:hypothetical protein BJ925_0351 [Rahnella aquatilis]|nr:hypothetical protein BJ925_0351 [Rahnella aquatilis]
MRQKSVYETRVYLDKGLRSLIPVMWSLNSFRPSSIGIKYSGVILSETSILIYSI